MSKPMKSHLLAADVELEIILRYFDFTEKRLKASLSMIECTDKIDAAKTLELSMLAFEQAKSHLIATRKIISKV